MRDLLKTKTFWGGVSAIFIGVGMIYTGNPVEGMQTICGGLAAIFLRDGIRKGAKDNSAPGDK